MLQVGSECHDRYVWWDDCGHESNWAGPIGRGQHDGYSAGILDCLMDYCGESMTKLVSSLVEVSRHVGWWIPHENTCWVSDRMNSVLVDGRMRLHNENGPAFSYSDGFCGWFLHGVRVSRGTIENPDSITLSRIEHEQNFELRRILIKRYGIGHYLKDRSATLVHQDEFGELYHVRYWTRGLLYPGCTITGPFPEILEQYAAVKLAGTESYISVNPRMKSAREAVISAGE